MLNVLIACEESQAVCKEFRKLGHRAFSCDIQECSGGHPEWHIHGDALAVINGNCMFVTADGCEHRQAGKWDILIAHPPCTYLSNVAVRHHSLRCTALDKINARTNERIEAMGFFMKFVNADCEHIAIENPVGVMNTCYRKPDQTIHHYMFADSIKDAENYVTKATCLWLKGLCPLVGNDLEKPDNEKLFGKTAGGKVLNWTECSHGAKNRSKTFLGIAKAMAKQWSEYVDSNGKYDVIDVYMQYKLFD